MPHERAHVVIELATLITRQHGAEAVITGRKKPLDMALARHDVQVIIQHDELKHALVRLVGIVGEAVSKMAVAAFSVRVTGFLLDLLARHYEMGIAELCHTGGISVARDAFVAGLVAGIIMKECEQQDKLDDQNDHPAAGPEEIPELSDGHNAYTPY